MSIKAKIDGDNNIIIQNSDNAEIIINTNDSLEIRKFLINFQESISSLPNEILKLIMEKNENDAIIEKGANIYLGFNVLVSAGVRTINDIALSVTITNLTKENRFFNQPFFKFSIGLDNGADSFVMTETIGEVTVFPKKLEYGEVTSQMYKVNPTMIPILEDLLIKDSNATITAITTTTIGEIYTSNPYKVDNFVKNIKDLHKIQNR